MKPKDIYVGRTYRNRGKGTTRRKVLRIEKGLACNWYSTRQRPDEPVVEYEQGGCASRLYLSSFAAWAGFDDTPEDAMSNDNTPQRPWSPGPWVKNGQCGVSTTDASMIATTDYYGRDHHENVANARAIATFPELYEAAVAYREASNEYIDAKGNEWEAVDAYRPGDRESSNQLDEAENRSSMAWSAYMEASKRLDAALAAALPPEDETP